MTREDEYLAGITAALNGDDPLPAIPMPAWHYEAQLAAIYDAAIGNPQGFPARAWHLDEVLYAVYCAVAGDASVKPPAPTCRIEEFWCAIYDALLAEAASTCPATAWHTEELLKALYDAAVVWSTNEQTLTGSTVSFIGRVATRILSLSIAFKPVQAGSGTPSPSNPRPVTGYTGLSAYVSPSQDQDDATEYTTDWTSEAGTIYGFTVDIVTGELTVTDVGIDLGSLSWQSWTQSGHEIFYATIPLRPAERRSPCLCAIYDQLLELWNWNDLADLMMTGENGGRKFYVRDDRYANAASFKTAMSGVTLVYKLETPATYQLTPQEVAALIGQNYVWSDDGNVTVTVKGAGSE